MKDKKEKVDVLVNKYLHKISSEEKRAFIVWLFSLAGFFLIIRLANFDFLNAQSQLILLLLFDIGIGGIAFLYVFVSSVSKLFKRGLFTQSIAALCLCGLITFGFFSILVKMPSAVSLQTKDNAKNSSSTSSSNISNPPSTPLSSPKSAQVTPRPTVKTTSTGSKITCIGPDDKQFETTMEECKNLNEKWGQSVDYMTNCNIHPDCGGGTVYIAKSECDKPCSGRKQTTTVPTNITTTAPITGSNYFCVNNVTGYTYYTSSGDQCNKDNYKATCLDFAKKIYYDPCMDDCLRTANSSGSYCIYNLTGDAQTACLDQKNIDHQSCMDGCSAKHEVEYKKCY